MNSIDELKKLSLFKSLLFNFKYVRNNTSSRIACFLYKKTVFEFDKSSKIIINKGRLTFNKSFQKKNPFSTLVTLRENSKIVVNGRFHFYRGSVISIGNDATLELGDASYLNSHCKIICQEKITIGDGVLIADNVVIRDSDMHKIIGQKSEISKPIHIGDHVWIGDGARIMKGVTIGNGAVVAAGAIVTKDVPPKTLVAGVPAKVVRKDIEWEA
ncbi:acyltransferase [Sporosarcina psychrophila]|uniref:Acetyltransferase-like isoleucine patch superfamily enzyme n=1 Tax=Sporosarcina psychrophila TaxID=1476 RepID=A0ABV2KBT7_SPOPS